MSHTKFNDDCAGCRPTVIDPETGIVFPNDSSIMKAINAVWDASSRAEREAFHRVCCLNGRAPEDIALVEGLMGRVKGS